MAMINMNSIPDSKPSFSAIIPKGCYQAKVVKGEMKQGKDTSKPPYLSVECDITDPASGTGMGKFWINLFESEAALCRYQLGRFIKALNLNIQGEFELKDLTKMINGKELLVDIIPDDENNPTRSQVDISANCFYPIDEIKNDPSEMDKVTQEINDTFTAPMATPQEAAPQTPQRSSSY